MLLGGSCEDSSQYFGSCHNREMSRTIVKRALLRFLTSTAAFKPSRSLWKAPDTALPTISQQELTAAAGSGSGGHEGTTARAAKPSSGGLANLEPQLGADFDHALVVHRSACCITKPSRAVFAWPRLARGE